MPLHAPDDHRMKEPNFLDAFVDIHSILYEPLPPHTVEPEVVTQLRDRIAMRNYFVKALSNLGLGKG